MTFVPEQELKRGGGPALAPMIDFLFLLLAVFAALAVTRLTLKETDLELVKHPSESGAPLDHDLRLVHLSISAAGEYTWATEVRDYPMTSAAEIVRELDTQHQKGLLTETKEDTHVLLSIDRAAQWEAVLELLLAVRDAGYDVRPVYEPE